MSLKDFEDEEVCVYFPTSGMKRLNEALSLHFLAPLFAHAKYPHGKYPKRVTKKKRKKKDPMHEGWNDDPKLRDAWSATFESDESP